MRGNLKNLITMGLTIVPFSIAMASPIKGTSEIRLFHQVSEKNFFAEGEVRAVISSTISSKINGTIAEVMVDVGDYIQKDQVLLRFVDKTQKADVDQAEHSAVSARIQYQESETEFTRIRKLYNEKMASESEYTQAKARMESMEKVMDAAYTAVIKADEILTYTVVRSPFSGVITGKMAEIGETVAMGVPLFEGYSDGKFKVITQVPEKEILNIKENKMAEVMLSDGRKYVLTGSSMVFYPSANPYTHSFKIRLDLPEIDSVIPGMSAKVKFISGTEEVMLVPASAVVSRGEVNSVYVKDGDSIAMRMVRVGKKYNNNYEILSGLKTDESVVINPFAALLKNK